MTPEQTQTLIKQLKSLEVLSEAQAGSLIDSRKSQLELCQSLQSLQESLTVQQSFLETVNNNQTTITQSISSINECEESNRQLLRKLKQTLCDLEGKTKSPWDDLGLTQWIPYLAIGSLVLILGGIFGLGGIALDINNELREVREDNALLNSKLDQLLSK